MTRLIVVTLLLAVVAVTVKVRSRSNTPGRSVRVTARTGLVRGATIVVVEVDGRRLLLGAAGNGVNLIAELGPASAEETATATQPSAISVLPAPVAAPVPVPVSATVGAAAMSPLEKLRRMTVRTAPSLPWQTQGSST